MTLGADGDAHGLALALIPALRESCQGRLGEVQFFRSSWQRGGAETAFSTWRLETDEVMPVILKLPVGPNEFRWTTTLGKCDLRHWHDRHEHLASTPRLIASGLDLGGYDLAWVILERLAGEPLHHHLDAQCVTDLLAAAADFQHLASTLCPVQQEKPPPSPDWEGLLHKAREACRAHAIPEWNHWNETIKRVQKALPVLRGKWESRSINSWCHGDLHPGNALRRPLDPEESASLRTHGLVLIDLALVHAGHWVEDALYLERQFWGHPEMLHGVKPVGTLAKLRREKGLDANDDYAELANLRRVLMGACAPAVLEQEGGSPKYLHAALEVLDRSLPQVLH